MCKSSFAAWNKYVRLSGKHANFPYLKSLRQHDVHAIIAFPGEELASAFHVLAKHGHLLLQFLKPHFRFFLNFLEQSQLLGLAPLLDEFLGDALEGLLAAAVLQFPKPVTGSFPWPQPVPA